MHYLAGTFSFGDLQWTEIFYAAIGSFIGIFIPLWIDKLREKKQEKEERRKLVSSLNKELQAVKDLIELYSREDHRYQIFSFSTFVWDSVVAAGLLPQMLSDSRVHCEMLIQIYSQLTVLRELHDSFYDNEDADELREIYAHIKGVRCGIKGDIDTYLNYES